MSTNKLRIVLVEYLYAHCVKFDTEVCCEACGYAGNLSTYQVRDELAYCPNCDNSINWVRSYYGSNDIDELFDWFYTDIAIEQKS